MDKLFSFDAKSFQRKFANLWCMKNYTKHYLKLIIIYIYIYTQYSFTKWFSSIHYMNVWAFVLVLLFFFFFFSIFLFSLLAYHVYTFSLHWLSCLACHWMTIFWMIIYKFISSYSSSLLSCVSCYLVHFNYENRIISR